MIKEIDREHNGYVTSTELADILRITYGDELKDKNVKMAFQGFESIQNRILIDYKKFKEEVIQKVKEYEDMENKKQSRETMLERVGKLQKQREEV